MTEILTESFCERCGTRYTFESARPRVRLKGVKVLSRGLKNFVLSDDTSIDEAMAAARSEADREASAHQLDAFHKTFNFCMSCRQYTCPNCWNEAEARCLSCAPLALPEAPADIHDLRELRQAVLSGDAAPGNGNAGTAEAEPQPWAARLAQETPVEVDAVAEPQVAAVAPELEPEPEPFVEPDAAATDAAAAEAEAEAAEAEAAAALATAEAEPAPETDLAAANETEPARVVDDVAVTETAEALAEPAEALAEPDSPAGKAASQTLGLLQRFRPGQSLDAELDAFERDREDAATTEALVESIAVTDDLAALQADRAAAAVPAAEAGTPTVEAAPELEPAPSADEPVPVAAVEAEVPAASSLPEPEPAPAPAPEEPAAPPIAAAADVVEQPTWRITAPDPTGAVPPSAPADQGGSVPLQASGVQPRPASGEPQWPARPEWPAASAAAGLPFLGRPATPQGGMDALWAASNQELVTAAPTAGKAATGIQPCISCGLSLSATARFCRRCGTLQGR